MWVPRDCAGPDRFLQIEKPAHYQFSFQQLAGNTHALLESLGVRRATVMGHSTGGMLGDPVCADVSDRSRAACFGGSYWA